MAGSGGVFKRGRQYWIRYSIGARQYRESANTTKKQLAEELLRKRQNEIFEGRFFPQKRRGDVTLEQLKERWMKHVRAKGKRTAGHDARRFVRLMEFFGKSRQLSAITRADVEDFVGFMREIRRCTDGGKVEGKPLAPATINRHLALLRAALNYAVEHKYIHQNPAGRFPLIAEDNERDRICSREEYEELIEEADPPLRLAIIIGYHTGMRLGEIANLRWDQIDLKKRLFRLRAADTKTRKGRVVPMATEVVDELKLAPRSIDGALLSDRVYQLSSRFAKLCRELEIKDLRFHDLRHTAATNLRRAGVDIFTIKQITGHKTLAMLERYNTIDVDDLREAVDRASKVRR